MTVWHTLIYLMKVTFNNEMTEIEHTQRWDRLAHVQTSVSINIPTSNCTKGQVVQAKNNKTDARNKNRIVRDTLYKLFFGNESSCYVQIELRKSQNSSGVSLYIELFTVILKRSNNVIRSHTRSKITLTYSLFTSRSRIEMYRKILSLFICSYSAIIGCLKNLTPKL